VEEKKKSGRNEAVADRRNEDPLTGQAGAHPVTTGIGAALGGAAIGALAGAAAGPIGTIVGVAVGAYSGGLAGKAIGEELDPTVEIDYWRSDYQNRPYYDGTYEFDAYEPAYRAGVDVYDPKTPADWKEREADARARYENSATTAELEWDKAKLAAKDAYTRAQDRCYPKPR